MESKSAAEQDIAALVYRNEIKDLEKLSFAPQLFATLFSGLVKKRYVYMLAPIPLITVRSMYPSCATLGDLKHAMNKEPNHRYSFNEKFLYSFYFTLKTLHGTKIVSMKCQTETGPDGKGSHLTTASIQAMCDTLSENPTTPAPRIYRVTVNTVRDCENYKKVYISVYVG